MFWQPRRIRVTTRPQLFGGAWPLAILIGFLALRDCAGAKGQTVSPAADNPVEWLADNPEALASVTRRCFADPGRRANTPDCINAQAARVIVARRELARAIAEADAKSGLRPALPPPSTAVVPPQPRPRSQVRRT